METFDPTAAGWVLRRPVDYPKPRYPVIEDRRELGNVTSTVLGLFAPRRYRLRYTAKGRTAYEYPFDFFGRQGGEAARFTFALPELLPTPTAGPVCTAVSAGTQGARTIYVKYCWQNAAGRTMASPATEIGMLANELLKVTVPPRPLGAVTAIIFATQGSPGTEQEQISTAELSWTQPDAALLVATTAVPTENTAVEQAIMKMNDYSVQRGLGLEYEMFVELEEAPV